MKERSARRAAPREGERSQVAEVLNICIVDPSTIWRHTAREILCRELGPCLIVGSRATRHVLSMREILYCEHAQRQTKIVMTTRTVTCSEKLNEIYGRLDPAEFVQTHCSFLVNLSYVKELRRTCVVLRSGVTVPLSRANYARVRQALAQHLSHALGGERPLFTLSER